MRNEAGPVVRSESYAYDAQDQLTGVAYKNGSVTERTVTYQYDAAGNRTNMVEMLGTATNATGYAANSDNQLTSASANRQGLTVTGYLEPGTKSNKWYNSTATSRGASNTVSQTNGTFSIPGVPVTGGANALTVTVTDVSGNIATQIVNVSVINGATAIGYDANGNQTNDAVWSYSYDRENRLIEARSQESVVSYQYDALGRLIQRVKGIDTNRMYYAGWQLIAEYDGANNLQRKYVYGTGIDEPIRMTAGSTNYYYHADGLGSVSEVTDSGGLKAESYSYDVYGTPTIYNASGVVTNASSIGNRLLFTARDRDPDTGWYNYRHRYYNPALGRFVQTDPIGTKAIWGNVYRYCANNPPSYRDPSGLCEQKKTDVADGDAFMEFYKNNLMLYPYPDLWGLLNAKYFLSQLSAIDIGETDPGRSFEFRGVEYPSNSMGNIAAGKTLAEAHGLVLAGVELFSIEFESNNYRTFSPQWWSDAKGSWQDNWKGMKFAVSERPYTTLSNTFFPVYIPINIAIYQITNWQNIIRDRKEMMNWGTKTWPNK